MCCLPNHEMVVIDVDVCFVSNIPVTRPPKSNTYFIEAILLRLLSSSPFRVFSTPAASRRSSNAPLSRTRPLQSFTKKRTCNRSGPHGVVSTLWPLQCVVQGVQGGLCVPLPISLCVAFSLCTVSSRWVFRVRNESRVAATVSASPL